MSYRVIFTFNQGTFKLENIVGEHKGLAQPMN